jgi:hypothetical protein
MAKYFSPQEINRIVAETEAEIDQREAQRIERINEERFAAYVNDPRNAEEVNNHPVVKALRQLPATPGWGLTAPQRPQRTIAPTSTPAPTGYKSRQQLEKERPWLAPRKPELESIIDPMAGRKPNRI